jgi:hypothetical protein
MNLNPTNTPKPGDLVLVEATDDALIPVGSYGVIIGAVNEEQQEPRSVVFNFTNPWWQKTSQGDEIVNASGGPQRGILKIHLKPTRKQRDQEFLNFDGPWGQDAAKSKTVKVGVWKTDLTKH